MKDSKFKYIILFGAISVIFGACLEPASYPPEPVIQFQSLVPNGNAAELRFGFTDGDGDVGLDQEDTTGVNCPDTCEYYYNLFLEYYELRDGVWTWIELDPEDGQVPFYYRIPRVTPSGQNPALNGEIKIDMPSYFLFSDYDTAKFEIRMVDRSLNWSNTEETEVFIKPD